MTDIIISVKLAAFQQLSSIFCHPNRKFMPRKYAGVLFGPKNKAELTGV